MAFIVADADCFSAGNIASVDNFLLELRSGIAEREWKDNIIPKLAFPSELWSGNQNDVMALAQLYSHYSEYMHCWEGTETVEVEVTKGSIATGTLQFLSRICHTDSNSILLVTGTNYRKQECLIFIDTVKIRKVFTTLLSNCHDDIDGAIHMLLCQRSTVGKRLKILGGGSLTRTAEALRLHFSFDDVEERVIPSRPTRQLRRQLEIWDKDPRYVIIATDQIGHSHIESIKGCFFTGVRTPNRVVSRLWDHLLTKI